ncbi:FAD:protein FMN transferase [Flagellimonas algicola]|uniref:FAD:protein FMN transferase n=1 Tax=Flagellimonas algicola TaxID=2583815 RepID=A0ABY2WPZ7_9FLAO|nr:FAD:protein FMN transferase [Allomuricauda algicola]TMU56757.1 FAD:protein FMN transferase [Allomuricauda algicola]
MLRYKRQQKLMGCSFELGVVTDDKVKAHRILDEGVKEIQRIEDLLSEFKGGSIITKINTKASELPVHLNSEVMELLKRCQQISKLSQGYFDITVGPLKKLYQFKNSEFTMPGKKDIQRAKNQVGYDKIHLDADTQSVRLEQENMHISMAAIGKGYAADKVKQIWKNHKLQGGYIDASGDLTAFGTDESGQAWKIGIANPDDRNQTLFHIPLNHASLATSGDYEQHFMCNGVRFSHNINPKTGLPVTGVKSVSIFSPSAELSDALATAVYAMGVDKGLSFLNQLPQTHGIIVDDQNKVFFTKQLQYEPIPA